MDVDGVKNEEKPDLDIDKDDGQHEEDPNEVMTISGQGTSTSQYTLHIILTP